LPLEHTIIFLYKVGAVVVADTQVVAVLEIFLTELLFMAVDRLL
jgi:hypothetical protein